MSTPRRLTRTEQQAQTREQLLATAEELFLTNGYASTSLEQVAERAGYSKGAVYSNFANKDDLCLAVLDRIHERQAAGIAAALTQAGSLDDRLTAFQRWADGAIGDPQWTSLEVEFAANLRANGRLGDELAARDQTIRATVTSLLTAAADELEIELPLPAEDLANAILSLGIGLGLRRAYDPTIPSTILTDVIRVLATASPARR